MRILALLSIVLATTAAHAGAQPHMRSATALTRADGSRLELSTRYRTAEHRGSTVNEAVVEVETQPPEPIRSGEIPPDPIRYTIEGRLVTAGGDLAPCVMPALFLLSKGYVTARQIFDVLGLEIEISHVRGEGARVKDRIADAAVLGFLHSQVAALRPDRAGLVAQLLADAGFPPGPCVPPAR